MDTFMCSTQKDAKGRPEPQRVSSVDMSRNWTYHAYTMAHDGKSTIVHTESGIQLHRGTARPIDVTLQPLYNPRDFMWHPDNKQVVFWIPTTEKAGTPEERTYRGLALVDTTRLQATPQLAPNEKPAPQHRILYRAADRRQPFGVEWSPKGEAVFVIEDVLNETDGRTHGAIMRIELTGSAEPREIVRIPGHIDFFMPPVSRYERGEGPSSQDYQIIFGHRDGLYMVDPEGRRVRRVSTIPATGLYNCEWSPDPKKSQLLLFFRRPVADGEGRMFKGVWFVDLDKIAAGREMPALEDFAEQLDDSTNIHTLWFSPRGKYMTWASHNGVWYRQVGLPADKTVQVALPPDLDLVELGELDFKGATWQDDESKLAFTAGNLLFVHEVVSKDTYQVATLGKPGESFAAEPRFVGDKIFLSCFTDTRAEVHARREEEKRKAAEPQAPPTFQFNTPGQRGRPQQSGAAPAPAPAENNRNNGGR